MNKHLPLIYFLILIVLPFTNGDLYFATVLNTATAECGQMNGRSQIYISAFRSFTTFTLDHCKLLIYGGQSSLPINLTLFLNFTCGPYPHCFQANVTYPTGLTTMSCYRNPGETIFINFENTTSPSNLTSIFIDEPIQTPGLISNGGTVVNNPCSNISQLDGSISLSSIYGSSVCGFSQLNFSNPFENCLFIEWIYTDPVFGNSTYLSNPQLTMGGLKTGKYTAVVSSNIGRCTQYVDVSLPPPTLVNLSVTLPTNFCPNVDASLSAVMTADGSLGAIGSYILRVNNSGMLSSTSVGSSFVLPFGPPSVGFFINPLGINACSLPYQSPIIPMYPINFIQPDQSAVTGITGQPGMIDLSTFFTNVTTISWNGPTGPSSGLSSTPFLTSTPGNYSANYTIQTCQLVNFFQVAQLFTISLTGQTNSSCLLGTGSITFDVLGGVSPFTYSLVGTKALSGNVSSLPMTIPNLLAGSYQITIFDSNSNSTQRLFMIWNQGLLGMSAVVTTRNYTSCPPTASIVTTAIGGVGPYTLSSGGVNASPQPGFVAGTYNLSVTDSLGCQVSQTVTVTIPPPISITLIPGASTLQICPGTPAGVFKFNFTEAVPEATGLSTVVNVTNPSVGYFSSQTVVVPGTADGSELSAGTYTMTASAGCFITNMTFGVTLFSLPSTNFTIVPATDCGNGMILGTATGFSGSFSINIYDSGQGFVGATGSDAITGNWQYSLPTGNYSYQTIDGNLCASSVIYFEIPKATAPSLLFAGSTPGSVCLAGAVTFSTIASVPYILTIEDNGITVYNNTHTTPTVTIALPPSNYQASLIDSNGCPSLITLFSILTLADPSISIGTIIGASACQSGSVQGTVATQGVPSNIYNLTLYDAGGGFLGNYPQSSTSWTIGSLVAGNYFLVLTNANGCTSANYNFTIPTVQPIALSAPSIVAPTCVGGTNGNVTITISGGKSPFFVVSISPNSVKASFLSTTTFQLSGIGTTVSFSVKDSNGCATSLQTINISPPEGIVISTPVTTSAATCGGKAPNGQASVQFTSLIGTIDQYIFVWSDQKIPTNSADRTNLKAGAYSVQAINTVFQCSSNVAPFSIEATGFSDLATTITNTKAAADCLNGLQGQVQFSFIGGVGPFSYQINGTDKTNGWYSSGLIAVNDSSVTQVFSNLPIGGAYNLIIYDSVNCAILTSFSINSIHMSDFDQDGVCDVGDNCFNVSNPDQSDIDGDGLGDACDPCPANPSNLDSDGDNLIDCLDGCPFNANLTAPTICGCVVLAQCNCNLTQTCEDITYTSPGDNTTTSNSFGGNTPTVGVTTTDSNNRTLYSTLDWSSIVEVDPKTQQIYRVLNFSSLSWTRKTYVTNTSVLVNYTASHQFNDTSCPLTISLSNQFSNANSSAVYGGITFSFTSPGSKFSLILAGCWGFADPNHILYATFEYNLPNSSFVAPPTDCNGKIIEPSSNPINVSNATGKYETVTFHTEGGGVIQTQVLTVADVDGQEVTVPFDTFPLRGDIRLQFPYFRGNLTYDPTLLLLFGSNSNGGSCNSELTWIGPLVAFGIAAGCVIIAILAILYFPPANLLFFGTEGGRVQKVRTKSERFSSKLKYEDYDQEMVTPSTPHETEPGSSFMTTENW